MAILGKSGIFGSLVSLRETSQQAVNSFGKVIKKYEEHFKDGWDGWGWKIFYIKDTDRWRLSIDELIVRKAMYVYELIISKIRSISGALMISPAHGKVSKVEKTDGGYIVEFEDVNEFVVGDFARCHTWTGGNIKDYWLEVTKVDGERVTLSVTNEDTKQMQGEVEAGDELVLMGSKVRNRQGYIYLAANEDSNPIIEIHDKVSKRNTYHTTRAALGDLSQVTDTVFGSTMRGYGLFSDNCYLTGEFRLKGHGGESYPIPKYRGQWQEGTTAYYYDYFSYEGRVWLCITSETKNAPSSDGTEWTIYIDRGKDGDAGKSFTVKGKCVKCIISESDNIDSEFVSAGRYIQNPNLVYNASRGLDGKVSRLFIKEASQGDGYVSQADNHLYVLGEDKWVDMGEFSGAKGEDGKDAVVVECTPNIIAMATNDKGEWVAKNNTTAVRLTSGTSNLTIDKVQIRALGSPGNTCTATATKESGTQYRIEITSVETRDYKTTIDGKEEVVTLPAPNGYIGIIVTYTDADGKQQNISKRIDWVCEASAFFGGMECNNRHFRTSFTELQRTTNDKLEKYESDLEVTAREIRAEVMKEIDGQNTKITALSLQPEQIKAMITDAYSQAGLVINNTDTDKSITLYADQFHFYDSKKDNPRELMSLNKEGSLTIDRLISSGLMLNRKQIITNENIEQYFDKSSLTLMKDGKAQFLDVYSVPKFEKAMTWYDFQLQDQDDITNRIYLDLPALEDLSNEGQYTTEEADRIRAFVGNKIVVYNNNESVPIHLVGYTYVSAEVQSGALKAPTNGEQTTPVDHGDLSNQGHKWGLKDMVLEKGCMAMLECELHIIEGKEEIFWVASAGWQLDKYHQ